MCRKCGIKGHTGINLEYKIKVGLSRKRVSEVCEQPTNLLGEETVACPLFKIHERKSNIRSHLDTIQLRADQARKTN